MNKKCVALQLTDSRELSAFCGPARYKRYCNVLIIAAERDTQIVVLDKQLQTAPTVSGSNYCYLSTGDFTKGVLNRVRGTYILLKPQAQCSHFLVGVLELVGHLQVNPPQCQQFRLDGVAGFLLFGTGHLTAH